MKNNFAIFILSHGRPDEVRTLSSLKRCHYTGNYYIILDDEDTSVDEYRKVFGESHIVTFSKQKYVKSTDTMENTGRTNAVIFARNACFDIAQSLGLTYFLVLDDDYGRFEYRYVEDDKLMTKLIDDFDSVCMEMVDFLEVSGAHCVAFAQGGDLIGGKDSARFKRGLVQKVMNSFFLKVDRRIDFCGLMNEDVNAYIQQGSIGKLFFTVTNLSIVQKPTQQSSGGLTELYTDSGTYEKSFYSVICSPSSVKVAEMGDKHKRVHHLIDWNSSIPKILSERFKV